MEHAALPLTRDLVFIGGGHTHALVLHSWAMKPLPGVRVTLINPEPVAAYSGMLPGYIAGHYARDELDIDLVRLARRAGARLVLGKATGIDRDAKRITVEGAPPIAYDLASIDIGITSTLSDLPGFAEHGLPAKPLSKFARAWATFRKGSGPARIAVIGAGVAGAEVSMAMAHALRADGRDYAISLVEQGEALSALGPRARRLLKARIAEHGVELFEHVRPVRLSDSALHLEDGRHVPADLCVGAAGSNPYGWLKDTGLTDEAGFIPVDAYLRSPDASIYAVGDCAELEDRRPKSGVYAVRQAPFLFNNLRHALSGAGAPRRYVPQRDYLKLISMGRQTALGEKWGISGASDGLWRLKDRIDEKFMGKLNQLVPAMSEPLPWPRARGGVAPDMLCGGCGSKVGQGALRAALARGPGGDGDDAGLLEMGDARQVISTDHLRDFVGDPVLLTRIAAVHALGDIWAMGAEPQAALASIILPRQSPEMAERALGEIMEAAEAIMDAAGARIVGGHTTQGAELTIGFTVTGLCARAPITLGGAEPGDSLILTKPIGSGTLVAAAMRGRARGWDVAGAWEMMQQSSGAAAAILRDAHAMTDVTGFGLLGHLRNIAAASGVGAELDLATVPLLPGALALAERGIRSSLFEENLGGDAAPSDPRRALLYDPQTAGGLLAAVSGDPAPLLSALTAAGYEAAEIGRIVEGAGVTIS